MKSGLKSIGQVAKLVGVEVHTIRFWASEFSAFIFCTIGDGNRRYFSDSEIEKFKKIQLLLHVNGHKIKYIKENSTLFTGNPTKQPDHGTSNIDIATLSSIALSLESIKNTLRALAA